MYVAIHSFFQHKEFQEEINETQVVLVPKSTSQKRLVNLNLSAVVLSFIKLSLKLLFCSLKNIWVSLFLKIKVLLLGED